MNVVEYFSCFTELPIKINDIIAHAKENSDVDEFRFSRMDIDSSVLFGLMRKRRILTNGAPHVIAEIVVSSEIQNRALLRMVCCKEILHVFDNDAETARSFDAVNDLIDSVVAPPTTGRIPETVLSDNVGMLYALMVLLPRDALEVLRPRHDAGELSVEDVAQLADIPPAYARLALSRIWTTIVERID